MGCTPSNTYNYFRNGDAYSNNYILSQYRMNWTDAINYCENTYGTSLASIIDATQNSEVQDFCCLASTICWIGLNDRERERKGTRIGWLWSDNTTYNYETWHDDPREPTNNGDCVYISGSTGDWYDTSCETEYYFFCNYGNLTKNHAFVRTDGCDYGYCTSKETNNSCTNINQTTACQSIDYAWDCFNGIGGNPDSNGCKQQGFDGTGIFDIGEGVWDFPYNLSYYDEEVIIRGQGASLTTLKFAGSGSNWIECHWRNCSLVLKDLTITANQETMEHKQFHVYNGGTVYFRNVLFDGDYIGSGTCLLWMFYDEGDVLFEDCNFTNIDNVLYKIINGVSATFRN